ncbi:hypothetical protein KGD82_20245 [Nocardiopsis eucommiae]|uniref:DUF7691 domain-containing protein n=1 Tax=Nocardiopsis eucommiae TaxID=2831970 RepID=A0A975LDN2_9ACTN|nr:hypothetical protein KGD82_20245 [Nocardiopsis eucommiae]
MAFSVDMDRISRPASETVRSQCEMYGRFLDNRCFYPVKYWWLEEVDQTLSALGVNEVRVEYLAGDQDDGDSWSAKSVGLADEQARAVTPERIAEIEDPYTREAVTAVLGWIRTAAGRGHGIIGFFH